MLRRQESPRPVVEQHAETDVKPDQNVGAPAGPDIGKDRARPGSESGNPNIELGRRPQPARRHLKLQQGRFEVFGKEEIRMAIAICVAEGKEVGHRKATGGASERGRCSEMVVAAIGLPYCWGRPGHEASIDRGHTTLWLRADVGLTAVPTHHLRSARAHGIRARPTLFTSAAIQCPSGTARRRGSARSSCADGRLGIEPRAAATGTDDHQRRCDEVPYVLPRPARSSLEHRRSLPGWSS
jgi:hypothetical protein